MSSRTVIYVATTGLLTSFAVAGVISRSESKGVASKLVQVQGDFKALRTAAISFAVDYCGATYPADTAWRLKADPTEPLTFETAPLALREAAFRKAVPDTTPLESITTPVAYIEKLPADPFADRATYGYFAQNWPNSLPSFVLHSPGPDGVTDIPLPGLRSELARYCATRPTGIESAEDRGVIREMVAPHLYDPTNGTVSHGDLIWIVTMNGTYGWDTQPEEWRNAPAPQLPLYADSVTTAPSPSWLVGDPWPEPSIVGEQAMQKSPLSLPTMIADAMTTAGILKQGVPAQLDNTKLDQVRNHLAPFQEFFKSPHPLTDAEAQALEAWMRENPDWWTNIGYLPATHSRISGPQLATRDIYNLMPLYGKSVLLQAAYESRNGNKPAALARIDRLGKSLADITWYGSSSRNPYEARVHQELQRLMETLEHRIRSQ